MTTRVRGAGRLDFPILTTTSAARERRHRKSGTVARRRRLDDRRVALLVTVDLLEVRLDRHDLDAIGARAFCRRSRASQVLRPQRFAGWTRERDGAGRSAANDRLSRTLVAGGKMNEALRRFCATKIDALREAATVACDARDAFALTVSNFSVA